MTDKRNISGKFGAFPLDEDKIDDATLALLRLGLHAESRAWKGFDWDSMERLHEKGFISDPVCIAALVIVGFLLLTVIAETVRASAFGQQPPNRKNLCSSVRC
ncbi:DUF6429 family protein [Pseudaestuariivita rosea]|uniref:DUF6429 family protein n=1 Tax=Pseudaestuariivita rosea TaxID=2763263 RepID=UPI001ABAD681|nr:DUF6429 family protein [Pseudaestuariivita rosea]